jgi:peptidoglycan/LPS O-acetylase OafA/YrhL
MTASAGTAPAATGTPTGVGTVGGVGPVVLAAVLDACCVVVFVTIGRHTHHDGDSLAGIWHTAWPFFVGLAIGIVASRYWRRPLALAPAGLGAWLGAAGAGMVIRVLAGQGTEAAFIAVAAAFLALFLLGWRELAIVGNHLWRMSHSYESRG